MISWAESNMDSSVGADFVRVLKYTLLANYLTVNKYDLKLFQDYIKKPSECHGELNDKQQKK
jgi:hypothetical protein